MRRVYTMVRITPLTRLSLLATTVTSALVRRSDASTARRRLAPRSLLSAPSPPSADIAMLKFTWPAQRSQIPMAATPALAHRMGLFSAPQTRVAVAHRARPAPSTDYTSMVSQAGYPFLQIWLRLALLRLINWFGLQFRTPLTSTTMAHARRSCRHALIAA